MCFYGLWEDYGDIMFALRLQIKAFAFLTLFALSAATVNMLDPKSCTHPGLVRCELLVLPHINSATIQS